MLKKIKQFLFSKRGNAVIIMVVLLPAIILLFTSGAITKRRENIIKGETTISLDSFCKFANDKYGIKLFPVKGENGTCIYPSANEEKIRYLFDEYYKSTDGYNYHWTYTLTFGAEEQKNSAYATEYFTITCTLYYPKLLNKGTIINHWGTFTVAPGTNTPIFGGIENGWYSTHPNELTEIDKHFENGKSNQYWDKKIVEVKATCA